MEKYYFPNLTTWIKILIADCIKCQTNKVFANTKTKSKQEQLAPTKSYFNGMIMIDTKGPIHTTSEGNNFIFVIVDAFSHYVIPKYKPKTKNWQSTIVEKDDLIIERNQKRHYTVHHNNDYLRLINNIKQNIITITQK